MPKVARYGDPGSHGGTIVTASETVSCEGKKVARKGDTYACPVHGPNPIVQGSSKQSIEGAEVARIGDKTACGAEIVSGATLTADE